jgi:radical SAM superfamily enzyme YgiQ (UPF0313 family)
MKIYLLNPPFVKGFVRCGRWQGAAARSGGLDYPKWLAYATGLLEKDFDVKLIDAPARKLSKEDILEDVSQFRPDMIISDTNFSSLKNDIDVTLALKSAVDAKAVLVGPPMARYSNEILRDTAIDVTARYEYDLTLYDLASTLEEGGGLNEVDGISFKEGDKIIDTPDRDFTTDEDLNALAFVSRVYGKYLNIRDYYLSQSLYPEVQIFAGRGCPFHCTFCSWPENLMGRKYRCRSPDNIADEFEYIENELPDVKEIFIEDDTFTLNKHLVRTFCSELKKRKINMVWSCNARATLDYSTMKSMKDAGCRLVIVGYESGSDEILMNIKKGVTTEQMRMFNSDAKRAKLLVHGDFMIGLPGETKETAKETLKFIKELKPNILQVAVATPIPGTEFYNYVKEMDFLLEYELERSIDDNGFQKCIVSYPGFNQHEIVTFVNKALREYYLNPSFLYIALSNVMRKNGLHELKSMGLSAKVFLKYITGYDHD